MNLSATALINNLSTHKIDDNETRKSLQTQAMAKTELKAKLPRKLPTAAGKIEGCSLARSLSRPNIPGS